MNDTDKFFVAGHKGLIGSAIVKNLRNRRYNNILTVDKSVVDLRNQKLVNEWFSENTPDYVFLSAAKVGGIKANSLYPAEFIYDNLQIQNNIIHACHTTNVKKFMFLGSVCIYPKFAPVPVKEEYLLSGELEPTNEFYAIAKIAGIKLCQSYRRQYKDNFVSVMPCNLYGQGDNFHLENSHVLPALLRKFHEAKINKKDEVVCWGDGTARREFLNSSDAADACVFLMDNYDDEQIINIGYGEDYLLKDVVEVVQNIVEYKGNIVWDTSKPNGTPKRLLDSSKLFKLGWKPKVTLYDGLKETYEWFKQNVSKFNS